MKSVIDGKYRAGCVSTSMYRYSTIGAILSSPAVDAGVVHVGSMDGNLYALE